MLPGRFVFLPALLAIFAVTCKTTPGKEPGVVVLPEKHLIEIRGFEFKPGNLNISVGDTVVWENKDIVPHTTTAVDSSCDLSNIQEGTVNRKIFVAEKAGRFPYYCRFHPAMTGVLTVE